MAQKAPATVVRSFKFRLYPTREQESKLLSILHFCCDLWNSALEQRITWYRRRNGKSVSYKQQSQEFFELRREEKEARKQSQSDDLEPLILPGMNAWTQQEILVRLNEAFQRFFDGIKQGRKVGFPRFKPLSRMKSFRFSYTGNAGGIKLKRGKHP